MVNSDGDVVKDSKGEHSQTNAEKGEAQEEGELYN